MEFSNSLIDWYLQNKRNLPWRNTNDPYQIWLSEIILQQTRVAQGMPYFEAFIRNFPTVLDLASASEEEVLKLWQGLGYYSRARNLHAAAKYIVNELNGVFPSTYKELLELKGVGDYTAAAIASFSYNEPVAVVDGNVFRVLARIFNISSDIAIPKTKKEFQKLAQELLPIDNAASFNQAIMEFGALQCVPKSPNCEVCVFNSKCLALQKKIVDKLPVKQKKVKVRNRYFNYLIIIDKDNNFVVEKREDKGIWFNLYQFELLESDDKKKLEDVVAEIKTKFKPQSVLLKNTEEIIHKLSHQHLYIHFFELKFDNSIEKAVPISELIKLPFPIVIHNFIESNYL
ncbi:A/G-specific adenine glycosylase [Flavobacterium sediminilitoris]|uniref:Adenine DNA glycosylase n=1 Tax=Flavobacterium sediminilitoris TaxID=2024526 RepID=A0ABY4HQF0_9FLAO|nr:MULTISPECIES: A/G-specific adenine glycosylase [Flavobacterium]UOX34532.1 A/G-specific adenine glycosylase [Flavobacterium sediminilitoris]